MSLGDKNDFVLQMQMMPASANVDWILQLLVTPFFTSGRPLSKDGHSQEIHVVGITIVNMDDPVSGDTKESCTSDHYVFPAPLHRAILIRLFKGSQFWKAVCH